MQCVIQHHGQRQSGEAGGEGEGVGGAGEGSRPSHIDLGISDRCFFFFVFFFSFKDKSNWQHCVFFSPHVVVENHSHRNDRRHRPS